MSTLDIVKEKYLQTNLNEEHFCVAITLGYWYTGNSVHDLVTMFMDPDFDRNGVTKTFEQVAAFIDEVADEEGEFSVGGLIDWYLNAYKDVKNQANTVISG